MYMWKLQKEQQSKQEFHKLSELQVQKQSMHIQ